MFIFRNPCMKPKHKQAKIIHHYLPKNDRSAILTGLKINK